MSYYLISICASCGKKLGLTPTDLPESHGKISHGTCAKCLEKLYIEHFSPSEIQMLVEKAKQRELLQKLKKD